MHFLKLTGCYLFILCLFPTQISFTTLANAQQFESVHQFAGLDGRRPGRNDLVYDGTYLYGMTTDGGLHDDGVFFRLHPVTGVVDVLHDFTTSTGYAPTCTPILVGNTFYGMTNTGGSGGVGVVFSMNKDGSGYQVLHEFLQTGTNGSSPVGGVRLVNGRLMGMTQSGGANARGTLFSLNTDGSSYTVHHAFDLLNGSTPLGDVLQVGNKVYGLTRLGGVSNGGVLFSANIDGSGYTVEHDFDSGAQSPRGSLTSDGTSVYGMTTFGGPIDSGTIFSFNLATSQFTVLHGFSFTDGDRPQNNNLLLVGDRLYGMATHGGAFNKGTIFSIKRDGAGFMLHHSFAGGLDGGDRPYGGFVNINGLLYGMTWYGGTSDNGVIFLWDTLPVLPDGWKFLDGFVAAGQISDLFASDDMVVDLQPVPTSNPLKQKINMILQATSDVSDPVSFRFALESRLVGAAMSGDVVQTVELWNYTTGQYDLLDSRPAPITKEMTLVSPAGDLSEYVQPGTREVTANITWKSEAFTGAPFNWTVDADQAIWTIR